MAITDNITGIKIGNQEFLEGTTYNIEPRLSKTLQAFGLGTLSLNSALARFDVTRNRLTVYVSGVGSLGVPLPIPITAKFVLDGKASAKKTGVNQIARDFKVRSAGAGAYASTLTTELLGTVGIKNLKVGKVDKALNKGIEQKGNLSDLVSSKIKPSSSTFYASPGPIGSAIADLIGVTPAGNRATGLGAYASDFAAGTWYDASPFPLTL
jgi:hypothetical protein